MFFFILVVESRSYRLCSDRNTSHLYYSKKDSKKKKEECSMDGNSDWSSQLRRMTFTYIVEHIYNDLNLPSDPFGRTVLDLHPSFRGL